ncbi:mechanosensitive ion channel family protein [Priestia megaterium]|uniref:mechanosensitive ion channel family protein n=1 Tax=Priestia megaterium TaxID=1404 RepID=UPI00034D41AC|nr:mechanosensitive ion channel family protein [Priestia megaterium]AYE48496.1 mechanosensitive ion channel family protein [Priestia megaterium NCT-2]MCR8926605.1 mechanosensitive ion channel family protein [Priestia megaterium]UMZ33191.1 mechanosensitive ion channel family protein [Priestia megaterium]
MNSLTSVFKNVFEPFFQEETWAHIGEGFIKILLILLISMFLIRIGKQALNKFVEVRTNSPLRISERREATMVRLLQNVFSYAIYFVAGVMILETLSVDVRGLLAGAGIVGLAVGFGAQNLVKDIITGFFIIFEDQFSVGDYVRVGTFEGTVEEIGLRTTKIKSWTGEINILPNGSIVEVTNFSLHNSVAFVDVSISYEENIQKAEKVILELLEELPSRYEDMVKTPELLGVQNIHATEVTMRITSEVKPMRHFHISRMIRKEVRTRLNEHGIEVPFPRMVMYNRTEEAQHSLTLKGK